jgi:RNA polymerase sigma-70 factor (ECF subfamily)
MPVTSFRVLGPDPGERGARGDADAGPSRRAEADAALVAALRRGEPRAELEAWNRFSAGVDGTLRRLLGPGRDEDREDLLQEVFLRFYRRVDTLREPAAVRGFLTGICLHVVRGEIAARRRRRWLHLTDTGAPPDVPSGGPEDDSREAREAIVRYYRLLETLNGRDRSLFVTRTIEGLTLDEVAALHEVSVSTAQRRFAHATKRIATLVGRDPLLVSLAEGGAP